MAGGSLTPRGGPTPRRAAAARSVPPRSARGCEGPGVPTISAPSNVLNPINLYDRGRVACTCDEKRTASMLSGHTWNIINNIEEHEVYMRHARNDEHYINKNGDNTSHWFEKKKRVDLDGDGIIDCVDSSQLQEVMVCPGTAGKERVHRAKRQAKQLCQASAPREFGQYCNLRNQRPNGAPLTPERGGDLKRIHPYQDRVRDLSAKPTAQSRVVDRTQWTPRRGEPRVVAAPPGDHEMFNNFHQLRAESHIDTSDANFADAVVAARRPAFAANGGSAVAGTSTVRSMLETHSVPPKPVHERVRHSTNRVEPAHTRDITAWSFKHDPLHRDDAYYVRPVQNTGSSSVKYDIITGDGHQFWY